MASFETLPARKRDGKVRTRATVEKANHRAPAKYVLAKGELVRQTEWRQVFDTKTAAGKWARDAEHHLDRGHIPDCACESLDGPCKGLTVQEAAELAAKQAAEAEANRPRAQTTTLAQWRERWWPVYCRATGKAPSTISHTESRWANHVGPRWGETLLAAFDRLEIQEWVSEDLAEDLAPATVELCHKDLHLLLQAACDNRPPILEHNPSYKIVLPDPTGAEAIYTDPDNIAAIAERCSYFADLVWCKYATGWRWSEIVGLRDDLVVVGRTNPRDNGPCIDRKAGVLRIHPGFGCLTEVNGHLESGPPKTRGSARTTPVPDFVFDMIEARMRMQPPTKKGVEVERGPYVWLGQRGGLLRRSGFNRRHWRPACDGRPAEARRRGTAGHPGWKPLVPGMKVHGLRHSHKALLESEGIADSHIARRLGHTWAGEDGRSRISGTYSHILAEVDDRIVEIIDRRYRATKVPPVAA